MRKGQAKMRISFFALLLFLLLAFIIPAGYGEISDTGLIEGAGSGPVINPHYSDLPHTAVPRNASDADSASAKDIRTVDTEASASMLLRQAMKQRRASVRFILMTEKLPGLQETKALWKRIWNGALTHTGDPEEGDYLEWQWWTYDLQDVVWKKVAGHYELTFAVKLTYYTTAEEEKLVSSRIREILNEIIRESMSDYAKVLSVYTWICDRVAYDYDRYWEVMSGGMTPENMHIFSAYGAVIEKKCVCQGYAALLYRMLLELGIDNRIVTSVPHAFNMVRLNGRYYYTDATWDAHYAIEDGRRYDQQPGGYHSGQYRFFLLGRVHFIDPYPDHYPERDWSEYRISETDYADGRRVPSTGDGTDAGRYILMLLASLILLTAVINMRKKEEL